jgi:hypothetical protein
LPLGNKLSQVVVVLLPFGNKLSQVVVVLLPFGNKLSQVVVVLLPFGNKLSQRVVVLFNYSDIVRDIGPRCGERHTKKTQGTQRNIDEILIVF